MIIVYWNSIGGLETAPLLPIVVGVDDGIVEPLPTLQPIVAENIYEHEFLKDHVVLSGVVGICDSLMPDKTVKNMVIKANQISYFVEFEEEKTETQGH